MDNLAGKMEDKRIIPCLLEKRKGGFHKGE